MDDLTTTSEVLHSGTTASISMEIPSFFQKGDLVLVMARMWPGINKEGGVGKVIGVHYDEEEDEYCYDVKYTVNNGRELKVEEKYIKLYEIESGRRKIQGRCSYCGSFLKDCGHDEEFFRRKAEEDRLKTEALKRKRENNKEGPNKRKKIDRDKSIVPYEESVLFISDHNRGKGKSSSSTQEFYSESFPEGDFGDEEEIEKPEYDSDYREETLQHEKEREADLLFFEHTMVQVPTQYQTSSLKDDHSIDNKFLTISITEESKQEAKLFHKIFYDNCLFHNFKEREIYQQQLLQIKNLTDLHMLWTLINLCFNFIINITSRIHQFCDERDDYQYVLRQNLQNLRQVPQIAHKIESGEALEEDRRFAIAERIQTLAEQQQMYFEQFEKAGKDIFDQSLKRFRKWMKTIQRPPQSAVISNKKMIRQKLEQVNLQIDLLSAEMTDALRKGRQVVSELYAMFEQIFRMTVEEVLGGQTITDNQHSGDDPSDDMEETEGEENSMNAQSRPSYPRIHDISAEAADIRKKRIEVSDKERKKRVTSKSGGDKSSKRNVIIINDSDEEFDCDTPMAVTDRMVRNKEPKRKVISSIPERIKSVEQRKKINNLDQMFDFIDSEDDFELVSLNTRSFARKLQQKKVSRRRKIQGKDPLLHGGGNENSKDWSRAPTNARLHRFIDGTLPTSPKEGHEAKRENNNTIVEKETNVLPSLYQKVHLLKDPKAVYDGRVTVVYDVSSYYNRHDVYDNRYFINQSEIREGISSRLRLSDYLIDHAIPSYRYFQEFRNYGDGEEEEVRLEIEEKKVEATGFSSLEVIADQSKKENEEAYPTYHDDISKLFRAFEAIFTQHHREMNPDTTSSESHPYFNFYCQVWEAMTTSPLLPTSLSSSYYLMNETILFLPFAQQWQYFLEYLMRFLIARWKESYYSKLSSYHEGEERMNGTLSKLIDTIFSKDLEIFLHQKYQLQQENTFTSEEPQLTIGKKEVEPLASKETVILLLYIESVITLSTRLEEFVFSEKELFSPKEVFHTNLLKNLFLPHHQSSHLLQNYLLYLRKKYDCVYNSFCKVFQRLKELDEVFSSEKSVESSISIHRERLLACFDTHFIFYYMNPLTSIVNFLLSHPSYCLSLSAELLMTFSDGSSHAPSTPLRTFLSIFYQILQQVEDLSKQFQSLPITLQKEIREFSFPRHQKSSSTPSNSTASPQFSNSIMSIKYLVLKFFDKLNYHLHLIIDLDYNEHEVSSLTYNCERSTVRTPRKIQPNGVKPYQINDFKIILRKDKRESNICRHSGSLEVLWILLILYSNAHCGIILQQSLFSKLQASSLSLSSIFRIPSNWSLVKYIFRELLDPLTSLTLIGPANPSNHDMLKEIDKRIQLWMSYQERVTKLAFGWDQSISIGMESYLQILQQSRLLFDRLPSRMIPTGTSPSSDTLLHGAHNRKFDSKLFLLLTDLSLRQYQENKGETLAPNTERMTMITARERLQYQLSLVLHLLFRSQHLIDPTDDLFLSSTSSSSSALAGKARDHSGLLYYRGTIYRTLSQRFKDFLLHSILSYSSTALNSSSSSRSTISDTNGVTKTDKFSRFTFDLILYKKLKSEIKRQKKKLFELFQQLPTYSMGLVLLSLLQPCFTIFGYQTVVEEMRLYEECQKLFIESSFQLSRGDQDHLQLLTSSPTGAQPEAGTTSTPLVTLLPQECLVDPQKLTEAHRSFLLLYQAIVIFHPLPIYTELQFNTGNINASPSVPNISPPSLYITAGEFVPILKRLEEQQKRDQQTLTPFLSIYKMVHSICTQAYQNQDEEIWQTMMTLHTACITLGTNLLAQWEICTSERVVSPACLDGLDASITFRSDFSLPSLPIELIYQLSASLSFLIHSSTGKSAAATHSTHSGTTAPSSTKSSKARQHNKPIHTLSLTTPQLSEFSSYILVMKLMIEYLYDFIQQLSDSLYPYYHHLLQTSLRSEEEQSIFSICQEKIQQSIIDVEKLLFTIHTLLFQEQIQRWYHYQVKKCFIYSNTLTFAHPTIVRKSSDSEKETLFTFDTIEQYDETLLNDQRKSHQQRQYYRQWHTYSSLATYSQVLGKVFLLITQLETIRHTWHLSKSTIDLVALLQPINRCYDMNTSVSGRFLSNSSTTGAIPSDYLFTINSTIGRKTIETTNYFTYEYLKYDYFATVIKGLMEGLDRSNRLSEQSLHYYQQVIYPQLFFPQLGHFYQTLLVITSVLDAKSLLNQELELPTTLQRLSNFLTLMRSDDSSGQQHLTAYPRMPSPLSVEKLTESILTTTFQSEQTSNKLSYFDQFLYYLEKMITSCLTASQPDLLTRWLPSIGDLIFRIIRYLQFCQFHTNHPTISLTIATLMMQYSLLYGTFLNQSVPINSSLNTAPSTTMPMLPLKRFIPIHQISFYYHEFLESFIHESLASFTSTSGRSQYYQEMMTAYLSTSNSNNHASIKVYLQWMIIIFQSIRLIPFATQIKEWDRIFYPLIYLYALVMPTSDTIRLLSDGERNQIHALRNELMTLLVMSLITPALPIQYSDEENSLLILREKITSLLERFTSSPTESIPNHHAPSSISFTLSFEKMNYLVTFYLSHYQQYQSYQNKLFPLQRLVSKDSTSTLTFYRDTEFTIPQQHREFLSHLLQSHRNPLLESSITTCQAMIQTNDSKVNNFTITAGMEVFLQQLRNILQPIL